MTLMVALWHQKFQPAGLLWEVSGCGYGSWCEDCVCPLSGCDHFSAIRGVLELLWRPRKRLLWEQGYHSIPITLVRTALQLLFHQADPVVEGLGEEQYGCPGDVDNEP
jgi:hypothetical protein